MPLRARWRRAFVSGHFDLVGLSLMLFALCALFTALTPISSPSPTSRRWHRCLYNAVLAAAQTVVIVAGLIDLSFTSILALCGIAAQKLLLLGAPFVVVVLGAIAARQCRSASSTR